MILHFWLGVFILLNFPCVNSEHTDLNHVKMIADGVTCLLPDASSVSVIDYLWITVLPVFDLWSWLKLTTVHHPERKYSWQYEIKILVAVACCPLNHSLIVIIVGLWHVTRLCLQDRTHLSETLTSQMSQIAHSLVSDTQTHPFNLCAHTDQTMNPFILLLRLTPPSLCSALIIWLQTQGKFKSTADTSAGIGYISACLNESVSKRSFFLVPPKLLERETKSGSNKL